MLGSGLSELRKDSERILNLGSLAIVLHGIAAVNGVGEEYEAPMRHSEGLPRRHKLEPRRKTEQRGCVDASAEITGSRSQSLPAFSEDPPIGRSGAREDV